MLQFALCRSSDITKCMAKVMETEGNFEDINDGFAKIDIAEKFNNVYDREWANLSRWLAKQFKTISELELIQRLTSLMKVILKHGESLTFNYSSSLRLINIKPIL